MNNSKAEIIGTNPHFVHILLLFLVLVFCHLWKYDIKID